MEITGQIFVRGPMDDAPDGSGRKLFIVAGIIAVPAEARIEGETMYVSLGKINDPYISLVLSHPYSVRFQTIGNSISGVLKQPMWRF